MRTLAAALGLSLLSCTIIINAGGGAPVPVPVPLQCDASVQAPKLHVFFAVRLERSTANLIGHYKSLMEQSVAGLAGAGFQVDQVSLIRLGETRAQPTLLAAWGCSLDSPEQLDVADVLMHYVRAETLDEPVDRCVSAPLIRLGTDLANVVTAYPPNLNGTSGKSAFGTAPDQVLVVHIDALSRTVGLSDSGCEDARLLFERNEQGAAAWLNYAGEDLPPQSITHWLFGTDERVARSTFAKRCTDIEGFPANALDALPESEISYYEPLETMLADSASPTSALPLCEAIVENARRGFLELEITQLAGRAGLDVDSERLGALLDGGLDALAEEIEDQVKR